MQGKAKINLQGVKGTNQTKRKARTVNVPKSALLNAGFIEEKRQREKRQQDTKRAGKGVMWSFMSYRGFTNNEVVQM